MIDPKIFLPKVKPIVKTEDFVANGRSQIMLNLPGYYTEILLKINLDISPGYSPEAKAYPLARLIKGLKIQADNSRPFIELPEGNFYSGMLLEIFDHIMLKGSLYVPSLPTQSQEVSYQIPYHFGDNFYEPHDTTDVIATRGLSNLVLTINWGASGDLGTDYTINSGTIQAVVNYLLLQPGVTEQKAFAPKGWYPGQLNAAGRRIVPAFWQPGTKVSEVVYSADTDTGIKTVNFLNGFFLKDVLIFTFDNTETLVEGILNTIKIETKDGIELFNKGVREIELDNMRTYNYYTPLEGVAYINLREVFKTDRTGKKLVNADDIQWKLDLATVPSTVVFMYRIHHPAEALARVVGKRPAEMAI